jgi:hypothetical protein
LFHGGWPVINSRVVIVRRWGTAVYAPVAATAVIPFAVSEKRDGLNGYFNLKRRKQND